MAVRRARILVAVVALWIIGSWYYAWGPFEGRGRSFSPASDGRLHYGGHKELPDIRWSKLPTRYPVTSLAQIPKPTSAVQIPKIQASNPVEDSAAKKIRTERLAAVKESFLHSWSGYKKYAWLKDEVMPMSGSSKDPFGGWAATLVDSLDTLWIMGLKQDFAEAVKACDEIDFSTTQTQSINVFETTIRYLGGFLAAYELSGKKHASLLAKAVEVGELVMCAFDTPNHMLIPRWDWRDYMKDQAQTAPSTVLVSEIGSLSLEFTKLSQLTGDLRYHDAAQRISDQIELGQFETYLPGLWPIVVDVSKTPVEFSGDTFTLGAMADSLYEYFPKQYLLLGGALAQPRKLYEGSIDVAKKYLFRRPLNPDNLPLLFSVDARVSKPQSSDPEVITTPRAQHLTCFSGGMVGLASKVFNRPEDLDVAIQLTNGCVWAYNSTESRIGPETFSFIPCDVDSAKDDCKWSEERWLDSVQRYYQPSEDKPITMDATKKIIETRRLPRGILDVSDSRYVLRPEAIESVFLMYRLTGDRSWMDKAWVMFTAIEKHTRTSVAAASLDDVTLESPTKVDSMESFWLAETLKYFYLVFSEFDVVSLDSWVLNTEAHPLRRADAK